MISIGNMKVRSATASDIAAMASLMVRSYRAGFSGILSPEILDKRNDEFFGQRFAEEWSTIHIAQADNESLLGLLQVRNRHIDLFFVDPDHFGSAVARELLRHALALGAETLECFRDNIRARSFYERAGWILEKSYERVFNDEIHAFVFYRWPAVKDWA